MAFVVVYDACVLYPAPLRDLLMRIGLSGLIRARWTDQILEECFGAILREREDLDLAKLERTRQIMREVVPDCLVEGYEALITGLDLPDPNDRHVLAAAICAGAQVIVTFNLKDFPTEKLAPYGIEAKHPDDFLLETIDLAPGALVQVVTEQAARLKNPPRTIHDVLDTLRNQGLAQSVVRLRELLG